jgi:hypothetical protein
METAVAGDGRQLLPGLRRALTLNYQRLQLTAQQIAPYGSLMDVQDE